MSQPKCVAKISAEKAEELKVRIVKDADENIVINLDFGDELEITEFTAITYVPTAQNISDGITPPKRHS